MQKYLPLSLATVFNPDTEEITDIGCSVPNDLVTTNFGELFAGCFAPGGQHSKVLTDITNTTQTVKTYGASAEASTAPFNFTTVTDMLTLVQVGTGTTTPDRGDYNIETAFANGGPEDSRQNTNNGSHIPDNSTVQVSKIITPTGGGGTVQETCLFGQYRTIAEVAKIFLLSRDLVTISFLTGQSISVVYVWNL
jgi:hypothetical protein